MNADKSVELPVSMDEDEDRDRDFSHINIK